MTPAEKSKQWVKNNRKRENASKRQNRLNKLAQGKCGHCSQPRLENSKTFCEVCYFRDISTKHLGTRTRWQELKAKLEQQNYKCFYTGEALTLGINTSIDHLNPRSKFKEEVSDIKNLVWCTNEVNRMKTDNTYKDFLLKCNLILNYCKKYEE